MRERPVLNLADWVNLAKPSGPRSTRWVVLNRRPRQRPAPLPER